MTFYKLMVFVFTPSILRIIFGYGGSTPNYDETIHQAAGFE